MSFGFSVGDFITVTKLIAELVGSLRDVGGSKPEYQELVRELESLCRALQHVDKLNGQAVDSVKCAALMCRHPLEEFLRKIKKYEKSLGLGKSRGVVKDTARKIEWSFRKKDEVRKLRDYLSLHVGSINMLLMSHGLEMLEVASEQADNYWEDFQKRLEESRQVVAQVRSDVTAQALIAHENRSMLNRLFGMVSGDIAAPLKSLAELVSEVCVNTQQIYSVVLELRTFLPTLPYPDTRFTFFQAPIRVEDALGRTFPVPSEYSYDDLEAIIQCRFKTGPGHAQVKAGEWELCNRKNTRQVISPDSGVGLLPGMNVTMAILMKRSNKTEDCCPMPKCQSKETLPAPGDGRTCCECNVWFDQSSRKRKRINVSLDDGPFEEVESVDPLQMKRRKLDKGAMRYSNMDSSEELELFKNIRVAALGMVEIPAVDLACESPSWTKPNPSFIQRKDLSELLNKIAAGVARTYPSESLDGATVLRVFIAAAELSHKKTNY